MSNQILNGIKFERRFFGESVRQYRRNNFPRTSPFSETLDHIRKNQRQIFSWQPDKPSTPWSQQLFEAVKRNLSNHYHELLRLYVAVGTGLDSHWGVDAFFEIGEVIVTIDITTRKAKRVENLRSDFLITKSDIRDGFNSIGTKIADLLTRRKTGVREPYRPQVALLPK